MAMTTTNKQINLVQLDNELGNFGLSMNSENAQEKIIATADGSTVTENQLKSAIDAHVAVFEKLSVAEKLASVGLSIDDLKAALGV